MAKVALYFRRWKNYTRQKNGGENWAFASKLSDLSENFDDDGSENVFSDLEIFSVKFLGCTPVNAAKSEMVTANAIKNIISTAKASNKKLQRLKLSICPRGIETFDAITGETLHRISIYKISYCSADASHSNVFAFIAGAATNSLHDFMGADDTDELTCYAFLCAKRKIAHNLTITVARNFERAYELWKKSDKHQIEHKCELDQIAPIKSNYHQQSEQSNELNCMKNDGRKNLLIDFNADAIDIQMTVGNERQRQILQTNWVSFDDEALMNNNNNDGDNNFNVQPMAGKVFANNLWDLNAKVVCS